MYILKIKETQCVLNDSFDFRTLFIEIFIMMDYSILMLTLKGFFGHLTDVSMSRC